MKRYVLSVLAVAASVLVVGVGAGAAAVPAHSYSVDCFPNAQWGGNLIRVTPTELESSAGVGLGVVDGSGTVTGSNEQYVYYRVLVTNAAARPHRWVASSWKRVLDGALAAYPVQAFDPTYGWLAAAAAWSSSDMRLASWSVGLYAPRGTWIAAVQTYWAPPQADVSSEVSPSPPSSGVNTYDFARCTFN